MPMTTRLVGTVPIQTPLSPKATMFLLVARKRSFAPWTSFVSNLVTGSQYPSSSLRVPNRLPDQLASQSVVQSASAKKRMAVDTGVVEVEGEHAAVLLA